ncbi:MAG: hypothetical protein WA738_10535 [Candidatus Angelobacter sp.]
MQKLVVLGTVHQQLGDDANANFKKALMLVIDEYNVTAILEEWSTTQSTAFSASLAQELELIWLDIGTPDEPELKTHHSVINAIGFDPFDPNAVRVARYGPLLAQSKREEMMVANIRSLLPPSCQSALVIVGLSHLHSMLERLSKFCEMEGCWWIPPLKAHSKELAT